jgi:hypothetical protein
LNLRNLIAGYGIRWNIKFESHQHAYEAREVSLFILINFKLQNKCVKPMQIFYLKVIDEILREDLEKVNAQHARQQGKSSKKELGHFQEITILSHKWQSIKELNDELEVR